MTDPTAGSLAGFLHAVAEGHGIIHLNGTLALDLLSIDLLNLGVDLATDAEAGLFIPEHGTLVLVDPARDGTPDLETIRRFALPERVREIVVLSPLCPTAYPTRHSERDQVHGKILSAIRIGRPR